MSKVSPKRAEAMFRPSKTGIESGIFGKGRASAPSAADFPAFPSVVKPRTGCFVALMKYSALGSSRFTIPKEGTLTFLPRMTFSWLCSSSFRKRFALSSRYCSKVPWNSRCSRVTFMKMPQSKRRLPVRLSFGERPWLEVSTTAYSQPFSTIS